MDLPSVPIPALIDLNVMAPKPVSYFSSRFTATAAALSLKAVSNFTATMKGLLKNFTTSATTRMPSMNRASIPTGTFFQQSTVSPSPSPIYHPSSISKVIKTVILKHSTSLPK